MYKRRSNQALHTFALDPQTIRTHLFRIIFRYQFAVTISFLVFGVFVSSSPRPVNLLFFGGLALLLGLAYFILIFNAYRRERRAMYSVRVEVMNGSHITLRQWKRPPVTISRADVLEIFEARDGLMITTVYPNLKMIIPRGLANHGDWELRSILSKWQPFALSNLRERRVNWLMFWFSVAGGLMILTMANSLWIAVPLAVFLFFFGTYAENRLNFRYMVEPRITRSYSIAFSFLIVLIVAKSCLLVLLSFG